MCTNKYTIDKNSLFVNLSGKKLNLSQMVYLNIIDLYNQLTEYVIL